jgi:hypothetical protein
LHCQTFIVKVLLKKLCLPTDKFILLISFSKFLLMVNCKIYCMKKLTALFVLLICGSILFAQQDSIPPSFDEEEEDFSQYENLGYSGEKSKSYTSQKVIGQSPTRLLSLQYEGQLGYDMDLGNSYLLNDAAKGKSNYTQGVRFESNFPVYSRNNFILNLGANYLEARYSLDNAAKTSDNYLFNELSQHAIRSAAVIISAFKPLNDKHFIIVQSQNEYNGNWGFHGLHAANKIKYSGALLWGKKYHERKMFGAGISRSYRAGGGNYFPVVLFNYTAPSNNWGIEILAPARGDYRYNFSKRQLFKIGYELEGTSYYITNYNSPGIPFQDVELKRSELRFRLSFERSVKDFIWFHVQAGFRYNYLYNLDEGEIFRGFTGTQPFLMENTIGNPLYFNIGISLMSP